MAQLIVQIEGGMPVVHELTDDAVTIGRESDNTIIIADASVSRHHAEIPASDGPRTLRDLNSANGTAINGVAITEKLLKPGDVIHFGTTQASFVIKAPNKAKPAPPAPAVQARPPAPPVTVVPPAPPAARETPPAPAERPPRPSAAAKEPSPAPEVPPAPVSAPAVKAVRPAAVVVSPLAPSALATAKKVPPPAAKALPIDEEASLPAAKPPVSVAPAAPLPAVVDVQPPASAPVKTPLSAPAAGSPSAVAKTQLPTPVTSPAPSPAAPAPSPTAKAPPPATARPLPPPAATKAPSPASASKHWRPGPAPAKGLPSKPGVKEDLPATSATAGELPLVPADLGQRSPGPVAAGRAIPAFIGVKEREYASDDSPSFFARHRLMVAGLALLVVAAGAAAVLLKHPSPQPEPPAASRPMVVKDDSKAAETKRFWDQLQEISRAGLRQAQSVPLQQYPVMSSGIYDFQLIDDNGLDALMNSLTTRSRGLSRVSEELALLDKTNVDADLAAYGKKLVAHWERAASLDSDAMNVVWAVHARRIRPADDATPALESADVVPAEGRAPGATPVSMDHVTKLANDWLAQRDKFVKAGLEIDANEKEIYRQIAGRYKDQFK